MPRLDPFCSKNFMIYEFCKMSTFKEVFTKNLNNEREKRHSLNEPLSTQKKPAIKV